MREIRDPIVCYHYIFKKSVLELAILEKLEIYLSYLS